MSTTYGLLIFILAVVIIIAAPLLVIWALNALFPLLAIAYSMKTWAAVLILFWAFKPSIQVNKS